MDGKIFLKSLTLKNLLSFGLQGVEVELQPLNVLIGPNGSGKSNFIEAIRLLCSAPRGMSRVIIDGGGIEHWVWKGPEYIADTFQSIDASLNISGRSNYRGWVEHSVHFLEFGGRFLIGEERIVRQSTDREADRLYLFDNGEAEIARRVRAKNGHRPEFTVEIEPVSDVRGDESILAQRRDPLAFPEITQLANSYESVRVYSLPQFGRIAPARKGQDPASPQDFLTEDAGNLALILNDLQNKPAIRQSIVEKLQVFNDRVTGFTTTLVGGSIQVFFEERGLGKNIPAARLSDGTLRYLCLLAILLHPDPPPLVCIEEPELGMHPDIIPTIAELLIEASQRMQLIVTTHSDLLVSKLSDIPESVLVCDRFDEGTRIKRLEADSLQGWLQEYSLGEVWMRGAIGGTRW